MKLLILAVVIFLVAADDKYKIREDVAEQWNQAIETNVQGCLKESGQNEEDVRDMIKNGYYPNTPEFKRYLKCLAIKGGFISEDGIFNEEVFKTKAKAADLDIFEKSLAAVKDEEDIYEKIYSFSMVYVENVAKRYPPDH